MIQLKSRLRYYIFIFTNDNYASYYWATYKAIMRRNGVYSNSQGPHDFNAQLCEPIIKHLATNWEKTFAQRLPRVLQNFNRSSKSLLTAFHRDIESHCLKQGTSAASIEMLGQQLRNYEAIFVNLTETMLAVINEQQREVNREFTPVIAERLAPVVCPFLTEAVCYFLRHYAVFPAGVLTSNDN